MAKTKISEFSSNPSNNTDINGINIAEGCAPGGINNAIRQLMADLKDFQTGTDGDDLTVGGNLTASGNVSVAGTTTLGADPASAMQAATKQYVDARLPSGLLLMWPTSTAPTGWLVCNGQAVSRTTYAALFAVIGTVFGAGDNVTTFNLPDYRDRMPIGANSISAIGGTGGTRDAVVVSHTHTMSDSGNHSHAVQTGLNNGGDGWGDGVRDTPNAYTFVSMALSGSTGDAGNHNHTVNASGESGVDKNLPPYLGINFIIKV